MERIRTSVGGRGIVVVVAAAVLGMVLSTGVESAPKPLTKKKAMKLFYPRDEADAKFLDQSEGDGRYHRQGNVVISHNGPWAFNEAFQPAVVADDVSSVAIKPNGPGTVGVILHLVAPVNLGMRTYGLQSVSVCYKLFSSSGSAADEIDKTEVWEQAPVDPTPSPVVDDTDRTSTTGDCYSVSPASPYVPTSQGSLVFHLRYEPDHANDELNIYGVRATWVSTGTAPA